MQKHKRSGKGSFVRALCVHAITYGDLWIVTERTRSQTQTPEMSFLWRLAGICHLGGAWKRAATLHRKEPVEVVWPGCFFLGQTYMYDNTWTPWCPPGRGGRGGWWEGGPGVSALTVAPWTRSRYPAQDGWMSGWIKIIGEEEGRSLSKHRGTAVNIFICPLVLCSMMQRGLHTVDTLNLKWITSYIYQPSHAIDIFSLTKWRACPLVLKWWSFLII